MSAPEIEAIEERLKKLRADEALATEQLRAMEAHKAQLEHRRAMMQGAIQVLEEMRRELLE
jgi:predicted nuclease with TOPRIM domain